MVCSIWFWPLTTLVSLVIQCSHLLTPDTIDKRTKSSPTVTPFCREHNELDIYVMPAVTPLLFRNMQHANSRNTMVSRSALEGMRYFVHICLTHSAYFFLAFQVPPPFHWVPVNMILFVYFPYLFFIGKARAASLKRSSDTSGLLKKANGKTWSVTYSWNLRLTCSFTVGPIFLKDLPDPERRYEGLSNTNNLSGVTVFVPNIRDSQGKSSTVPLSRLKSSLNCIYIFSSCGVS